MCQVTLKFSHSVVMQHCEIVWRSRPQIPTILQSYMGLIYCISNYSGHARLLVDYSRTDWNNLTWVTGNIGCVLHIFCKVTWNFQVICSCHLSLFYHCNLNAFWSIHLSTSCQVSYDKWAPLQTCGLHPAAVRIYIIVYCTGLAVCMQCNKCSIVNRAVVTLQLFSSQFIRLCPVARTIIQYSSGCSRWVIA